MFEVILFSALIAAVFSYTGWAMPYTPQHKVARILWLVCGLSALMYAAQYTEPAGRMLAMLTALGAIAAFFKLNSQTS